MCSITEVYRAEHVVACCVCRRDIKLGVDDPATLDQFPVFAFDGTLDYIEVAHTTCHDRRRDIAAFEVWRREQGGQAWLA